jgi:hypothetical protein
MANICVRIQTCLRNAIKPYGLLRTLDSQVYNKLNGIETSTSAELVRYAAKQVEPIIKKLGGTGRSLLPGLRIKLLDGNCIEKSQHRIKELRSNAAGTLPAQNGTGDHCKK